MHIKRNLEFIKESFKISFKSLIEYKINLYISLISNLIFLIVQIFSFYLIFINFEIINNWNLNDYIFFSLLVTSSSQLSGIFCWGKGVSWSQLTGHYNNLLTKPLNTVFKYFFSNYSSFGIVGFISKFLLLILYIYYYNIEIYNLYQGISLYLILTLFLIIFFQFIDSFGFYKYYLEKSIGEILWKSDSQFYYYPGNFFQKYFSFGFIFFFPSIYYGTLLLPLLKNYEIWNIEFQIITLVSIMLILFMITIFNWHYGLKKYEAYG